MCHFLVEMLHKTEESRRYSPTKCLHLRRPIDNLKRNLRAQLPLWCFKLDHFLFLIRNFEESEDELREAVADSMKNLFVMADGSSDEEDTEERAAGGDGMEEKEGGGAASAAESQQIQPEVEDSPADVAAAPTVVVSCEPEEGDECSDDNTTLNTQRQTS